MIFAQQEVSTTSDIYKKNIMSCLTSYLLVLYKYPEP